jgi:branched-chain amino acid transport system permease protein
LFAIRDDEEVADGLGVPVFRYKMAALGANAFLAGLMGGLWSLRLGFVTVDDVFNIRVPLFVILMSVLGGMSHWMGPVVGAVIITTLSDRLNSAELADVSQIIIGALLVVLALAVREGVYLRMRDRWVTTAAIFFGVLAVVTLLDINSSFISDFAYAMVATTLAMLVPSGVWERMRASRGGTGGDGPPETPAEGMTEANT